MRSDSELAVRSGKGRASFPKAAVTLSPSDRLNSETIVQSIDIEDRKRAENSPPLEVQLQATLNVIPAYTWYAVPSGALIFVNERTADYLGIPKDHPLRLGIDT